MSNKKDTHKKIFDLNTGLTSQRIDDLIAFYVEERKGSDKFKDIFEGLCENHFPEIKNLTIIADQDEVLQRLETHYKYEGKSVKKLKEEFKRKAYFEKGGRLYLEILTTDEQYKFAYLNNGKVELVDVVEDVLPVELPYKRDGEFAFIVKLPDEDIASCKVLEPEELLENMETHIRKYCDIPDMDVELCAYYVLFTWFYKKTNTVGYLRFIADTGKGKSRMLTVVSDICFYPTSTGGSSSFSGMMRTNENWHGTLVMDEADIKGDKENTVVKYMNLGFEAGKYFLLSDKNDPKKQEVFDPFSPKIIGMRDHFKDVALEGRLLSISPHQTTKNDIPILLGEGYYAEARELRNLLARFVLARWDDVDGSVEKMISFRGMGLEPRLQQLAMPLSIIFQLWKDGVETFKKYMHIRQKEIKRDRAQSWQGTLFNIVYDLALGRGEIPEEFKQYCNENDVLAVISPGMVAKLSGTKAKTATQILTGIGFIIENRRFDVRRQRTYVLRNSKIWNEILERYYYDEEEENEKQKKIGVCGTDGTDGTDIHTPTFSDTPIPEILKSAYFFDPVCKTVPSVPSVPDQKNVEEPKLLRSVTNPNQNNLPEVLNSDIFLKNLEVIEKKKTKNPLSSLPENLGRGICVNCGEEDILIYKKGGEAGLCRECRGVND